MLQVFIRQKGDNVVDINDVYFDKFTFKKLDYFAAKDIISKIDGVELTEDLKIVSKFTKGVLDLSKLSTGCKTALNIVCNTDKIFNISECGKNALAVIYKLSVGKVYIYDLVTPLNDDISCNIKVQSKWGTYTFYNISDLKDWYSEVTFND